MSAQINLQGWPVLRVWRGAVYVRIPVELQEPITCTCEYCRTHPKETPAWDTLGIPLEAPKDGRWDTWTIHAPEWRQGDTVK